MTYSIRRNHHYYWDSLGQGLVLQVWGESWAFPTQSAPPYCGSGLVQFLVRFWLPPPHVVEQVPQDPQSAHIPSTEKKNDFEN